MNIKMRGQRIVEVPEIEGSLPCQYFGKNLCAGCYSEDVYRIRRVKVTGRARTPRKGLLRAGVWREWTYEDWKRLKQLFPERRYFLVSRGLWKPEHYEEVLRDPSCVNLQVSTWHVGDGFSPDRQTLQWLLSTSPKTIIRLLTTQENAPSFAELVKETGMWWRFMETPLRRHGGMKTYGTETPLQALGVRVGIRCNTPCEDCTRENGILGCAATAQMLERIPSLPEFRPERHEPTPKVRYAWSEITVKALRSLGGKASLQELYERAKEQNPGIEKNAMWQIRVRSRVQELGTNVGRGRWALKEPQLVMVKARTTGFPHRESS